MFTVPELQYSFDALEPAISKATMKLHHDRHHKGYVTKLNAFISNRPDLANMSIEELLTSEDTKTIPEIRRHGGGHYNHSLFWQMMTPNGAKPSQALTDELAARYGSFDAFKEQFTSQALQLFGSGWCWLEADLSISLTQNQDNPITQGRPVPLLGLDVWEHAYYLDYYNDRQAYIDGWWDVVDWQYVQAQFEAVV